MRKAMIVGWLPGVLGASLLLTGCPERADDADDREATDRKLVGVDPDDKVVRVGMLNDESGPGATIGSPFAEGKRILAERVNAGDSGLLPEGWTIELVERDHGYNPQQSVQYYNEIKDRVLFIGTSFGTPNTLPLRPHLESDHIVAFPASLSSKMAEHEYTPPVGTPYSMEAQRALDWAVEREGGSDGLKVGVVYQQDDYGEDGLAGWREAAEYHGVDIVGSQEVAPGQSDFTAPVTALKESGATYVLLATLPGETAGIISTAAQHGYAPTWLGNTPAWIDAFFDPSTIPSEVLANFYWVASMPYWGEDVGGMDEFLAAFEEHGGGQEPNFYILTSYVQGLLQLEAVRRQIEAGDLSRDAFVETLQTIDDFDAGGLVPTIDLSRFPYETNREARILEPDFDDRTWEVVGDYAEPEVVAGAAGGAGEKPDSEDAETDGTGETERPEADDATGEADATEDAGA